MTSTDRIDGLTSSVAIKAPVKVATTAAITLSGTQTVDGVAVVADDRVLVKDQSSAVDNGIYTVSSTAWSRAKDFDGNRDVVQGTLIAVKQGTVNGKTLWRQTTADTLTIGTSSLSFELADVFVGEGSSNRYNFDSTTSMADPGSGDVRFDNATLASVTALAVSDNTAEPGSPDISAYLATWDDSTTTAKGTITIRKLGDTDTFAVFTLTAATDNTGWFQFTVTYVAGAGSFSNADRIAVIFSRNGDKGTDGVISEIASQSEAEAGTNNTKGMTPLRTQQAAGVIRQNSQSAAYTTVLADAGAHILHPAADNNARTFTIDSNANVPYAVGTAITFINQVNTVTIAITSDTLTLSPGGTTGSRSLAANGMATAIKVGTTSWMISGTGLT